LTGNRLEGYRFDMTSVGPDSSLRVKRESSHPSGYQSVTSLFVDAVTGIEME